MCTDDEENTLDQEHLAQLRRKWLASIAYFSYVGNLSVRSISSRVIK